MAELNLDLGGWDNLDGIEVRFGLFTANAQKAILEDFGELISEKIADRTLQGFDKDGSQFEPYSTKPMSISEEDEYFDKALEAGGALKVAASSANRSILSERPSAQEVKFGGGYAQFKEGLGEPVPNLAVMGRLLGKQHYGGGRVYDRPFGPVEATKDSVTVAFTNSEQAAIMDKHIEGEGVPQRDPWGALETQEEVNEMSNLFVDKYDQFLSDAQEYLGLY